MFKNKFQYFTFIFLVFLCSLNIQAQLSKKHYLPPITSHDDIANQYIYISTPKDQNISFTIKPIGKPASAEISGTVSNSIPFSTSSTAVGTQLFQEPEDSSIITNDKGYIIEADDVIYVSVRMRSQNGFQAGAIVSKGNSALGTDFRMGGFANAGQNDGYLNFVSILATEDNTNIIFDDMPTGIVINNYTGTLPVNITLNEDETYIVSVSADSGGTTNDLIGTLIKSDKPIVVNSGSATGSFHFGGGRDYGMDQIVDASKIGVDYIFVRGDGLDGWENVLIIAHEDNTEIKVSGNILETLNKGQYRVIEGGFYNANGNMFVETSKPSFAYQGIGGLNNGTPSQPNQGLFFVPPLSCENRGDVNNIANIDNIGGDTFEGGVTIVTNKGATVTINGSPITDFNPSGPFNVDGNSNYETYRVSGLTGNVTVKSSQELYCAYFNYDGFATSGSFYSGFPSSPEINFDATVQSLGNCIPNVTLEAANTDLFDSFEWLFDDETGGGFISTGITNPSYSPTLPGRYKLVGIINCSGDTFESLEVPVSICPDDYDNDGIIDNLDVDIDNDGILNCDESIGNVTLNLADILNPEIIFQDNPTTSILITSTFTQSNSSGNNNTFVGQNNGDFISMLNPGNTTDTEYNLNFKENINFSFTQTIGATHNRVTEEYFILKIGPNNKNSTLLDPDNQLLVDTNFDGIFETGVTQISASEIWFTYNPNPTGTTPFKFVANQVNEISFKHKSNGILTPSIFNGNISITCFTLDSDGDNIENMFDLDSDNDGIPDLYDAFGSNIILTKTDSNLDGLDDVFNTIITNLDTDADTIKNYIDVDSDNDGIFDTTESGHNLDSDFNGFVDGFSDTNKNGITDSLEDTSLNINYTITDTDADSVFNFIESDADNDECFDVIEAGFTDANKDGILGPLSATIDANGKVTSGSDGYTNPNLNYIIALPILINIPFMDVIFCENSTENITIDSNADSFQWQLSTDGTNWTNINNNTFYSGTNTNSLQIINIPLNYTNYQYRVLLNKTENRCTKTSNAITLTVNPLPIINTNIELKQCDLDIDGITSFNLNEATSKISTNYTNETFTFFKTETAAKNDDISQLIINPDLYINQIAFSDTIWARVTSNFNCSIVSQVKLTISTTGIPSNFKKIFNECDDFLDAVNDDKDGIATFNFNTVTADVELFFAGTSVTVTYYENEEDALAERNKIINTSNYRNINSPFSQDIYIRVDSNINNDCAGLGNHITLIVDKIPSFDIITPQTICLNQVPLTISAENPADAYTYVWTDSNETEISFTETTDVFESGIYTVTASNNNNCTFSKSIELIAADTANLTTDNVTIIDDSNNNSITINNLNLGIENYEYALTNSNGNFVYNYQDEPFFENLVGGIYTILVRDKEGCGPPVLLDVSILEFPKFFTPNNDGINDTWKLKGVSNLFYKTSDINIYDRFGILISKITIGDNGWDGTFNGKNLPSNDYWYNILLIPTNPLKPTINKTGHFSLLRK